VRTKTTNEARGEHLDMQTQKELYTSKRVRFSEFLGLLAYSGNHGVCKVKTQKTRGLPDFSVKELEKVEASGYCDPTNLNKK
jgi:hypothetical protein